MPFTPRPWEVERDAGQYGRYTILQAAHEQNEWIDEGYEISDEEGDRRAELSNTRDENNRTLIQAAPDLYEAASNLITQWSKGNLSEAMQNLARALYKANPKLEGRDF